MVRTDLACVFEFLKALFMGISLTFSIAVKKQNQNPTNQTPTNPTNPKLTLNCLALRNESFCSAKGIYKKKLSHWVGF